MSPARPDPGPVFKMVKKFLSSKRLMVYLCVSYTIGIHWNFRRLTERLKASHHGRSPSDSKHSSFNIEGAHRACPCRSIQFWRKLLYNMWPRQINAPLESGIWSLKRLRGKSGMVIVFCVKVRGTSIKTYIGHGHEVLDVAIAEDNSRLASCGGDKLVFYWVRKKNILRPP